MANVAKIFGTHVLKRALVMSGREKSAGISDDGLRLTALSIDQTANILSAASGRQITEQMIRQDMEAGAPANPDGTVNLIHYTAWLVREENSGD